MKLRGDKALRKAFVTKQLGAMGVHNQRAKQPQLQRVATVSQLADIVEYLVALVGEEHVGIGGDVNGIDDYQWPVEMPNIAQLPRLTMELLRRGWAIDTLRALLGDNWLRVYRAGLVGRRHA